MKLAWILLGLFLLLCPLVPPVWPAENHCDRASNPANCRLEYANNQAQNTNPSLGETEDLQGVEIALALMNALTSSMAFGSLGAPENCPSSLSYQLFIWTARLQSFFEILWFRGFAAQSQARQEIFAQEMQTEAGDYAQLLAYEYLIDENRDTADYYEKKYQYHTLVGAIYLGAGVLAALELMGVICPPTHSGVSVRFAPEENQAHVEEEETAEQSSTSINEESSANEDLVESPAQEPEEIVGQTVPEEVPDSVAPPPTTEQIPSSAGQEAPPAITADSDDPYARYSNDPQTRRMLDQLELNAPEGKKSEGWCARYVKCAMWGGDCSKLTYVDKNGQKQKLMDNYQLSSIDAPGYFKSRPDGHANSMPTHLQNNGFTNIYTGTNGTYTSANPPVGAILTYSRTGHVGHVEVYNGKNYISDFRGKNPIDRYNNRYRLTGIYVKK